MNYRVSLAESIFKCEPVSFVCVLGDDDFIISISDYVLSATQAYLFPFELVKRVIVIILGASRSFSSRTCTSAAKASMS